MQLISGNMAFLFAITTLKLVAGHNVESFKGLKIAVHRTGSGQDLGFLFAAKNGVIKIKKGKVAAKQADVTVFTVAGSLESHVLELENSDKVGVIVQGTELAGQLFHGDDLVVGQNFLTWSTTASSNTYTAQHGSVPIKAFYHCKHDRISTVNDPDCTEIFLSADKVYD